MISFEELEKAGDKRTIWKMKSDRGREFHIIPRPKTVITKKFDIVTSTISEMSKVLGESFDDYVFELLSDYYLCKTSEEKLEFMAQQAGLILGYASIFIDKNGVDYSALIAADETIGGSTFPFYVEIKKLLKYSAALKIGSLLFNTPNDASEENLGEFGNLLAGESIGPRVIRMLEALEGVYDEDKIKRVVSTDTGRIRLVLQAKVYEPEFDITEAFAVIIKNLPVLKHDTSPIPYFRTIIRNVKKNTWPSSQQTQIAYEDDNDSDFYEFDPNEDLYEKLCTLAGKNLHREALRMELRKLIYKIKPRLLEAILLSSSHESKQLKRSYTDILTERLDGIQDLPPFWGFAAVPLLDKVFGIKHRFLHDMLLDMPPQRAALLSFHLGQEVLSIFGDEHGYLFEFASCFPKSKRQQTTTYGLKNVAQFIDATLKLTINDLLKYGWGSRITFARYIELFVGTTEATPLFSIVTGHKITVNAQELEKEAIDFSSRFLFSDEMNAKINQMMHRIHDLIY
jgi:hypothetical protein